MAFTRTVLKRVPKATDIEIHVTKVESDYGKYTEIREYVVSKDRYGRGITFPEALNDEIFDEAVLLNAGAADG